MSSMSFTIVGNVIMTSDPIALLGQPEQSHTTKILYECLVQLTTTSPSRNNNDTKVVTLGVFITMVQGSLVINRGNYQVTAAAFKV